MNADDTRQPAAELIGVTKRYDGPGGESRVVLRDVSLTLAAGAAIAIVGPSGSGKSTLLNILGTLDRPTEGSVRVGGRDVTTLDETQLARLRNRNIGVIFQLHHLLPQCTVLENVLLPTLAGEASRRAAAAQRAAALLERVGLGEHVRHRPGQLSGGERQRVAVVRALVNSPSLLLADEPTGSLDRAAAESLAELLTELAAAERTAMVVVTHSQSLAARIGDVRRLADGRLVREGGE